MIHQFDLQVDIENIRLDVFIAKKLPQYSRSKIKSFISRGFVTVNGHISKASQTLKGNEHIHCEFVNEEIIEVKAEPIDLDVVYEDEHLIVINKPSGLVVHPASGNWTGTLVNGLMYHFNKLSTGSDSIRPGIVHRLDKETTGVILVAKTDEVHMNLSEQFENRTVQKQYKAIVWGRTDDEGEIEGLIGRHSKNRQAFDMVNSNGKYSFTHYKTDNYKAPLSVVNLFPKTGRTHQLRVHLKSIGHPIFADELYSGGKKRIKSYHTQYTMLLNRLFKNMNRVALHAEKIEIKHPANGEKVVFEAPIPDDMIRIQSILDSQHE